MLAAADESYVQGERGVYAVAAVVLPSSRARQARKVAKELRLPGQQRLHRRDERQERQRSITERIGQLDLKAYAAVTAPVSRRKQERARATTATIVRQSSRPNAWGPSQIDSSTVSPVRPTSHCFGWQTSW